MRGVFLTDNGVPADFLARSRFDKVAVQDTLPNARELIQAVKAAGAHAAVWTASPDDTTRLLHYGAQEIILQGEENQADAVVLNLTAFRTGVFHSTPISVVTNLWPSRNLPWFDAFLHQNGVHLMVECYLPKDSLNQTPNLMLAEAHWRRYPHAEPVLGCYAGWDLAAYPDRGANFWVWDAAQMGADCWP